MKVNGINYFGDRLKIIMTNRKIGCYRGGDSGFSKYCDMGEEYNSGVLYNPYNTTITPSDNIFLLTSTNINAIPFDGYEGNVRKPNYPKNWDKRKTFDSPDIYQNITNPSSNLIELWSDPERNKYDNYISYIQGIRGDNSAWYNVLGGIVSGKGNGISLGDGKVGVISNFNIQDTLAGRIVSTLTGHETPMAKFGLKAAAISMANTALAKVQTNVVNQGLSWLKGKITFWDDSDDIEFSLADKSITVASPEQKFTLLGINTGIPQNLVDNVGEYLNLSNSATHFGNDSLITHEASIFDIDHLNQEGGKSGNLWENIKGVFKKKIPTIMKGIQPNLDDFLNSIPIGYGRYISITGTDTITRNEALLRNTGKMTTKFIYNALNHNYYIPKYSKPIEGEVHATDENGEKLSYDVLMHNSLMNKVGISELHQTKAWLDRRQSVSKEAINSGVDIDERVNSYNDGLYEGINDKNLDDKQKNTLLGKTKLLFQNGKINTMVSSFHSNDDMIGNISKVFKQEEIQTAITKNFGMSKGRNLLTKEALEKGVGVSNNRTGGYEDPYCRVWTWAKQYRKTTDLIRPFSGREVYNTYESSYFLNQTQLNILSDDVGIRPGAKSLEKNTVLEENGFLKIAPYSVKDNKKFMFSIENLAWKGINLSDNLCPTQIGFNGGRIMWFPPYDLEFNEQTNTNWSKHDFIGRGESLYTYTNTERGGTLKFKMIVDHPSIVNYWKKSKSAGEIGGFEEGDESDKAEQRLLRFFAGCEPLEGIDIYKNPNPEVTPPPENNDTVIEPENIPVQPSTPENPEVLVNVYFPNDFSGIDIGGVSTVKYLRYGIGDIIPNDFNGNGYEMGIGISLANVKNVGGVITSRKNDSFEVQNFMFNKMGQIWGKSGNIIENNKYGYWDKNLKRVEGSLIGNMHKRDDLKNYPQNNKNDIGDKANTNIDNTLPRIHYDRDISYWDVRDAGMNASSSGAKYSFKGLYDLIDNNTPDEFEKVMELLLNADQIIFEGFASKDGYIPDNKLLGEHRAKMIREWFSYFLKKNLNDEKKYPAYSALYTPDKTGGDASSDAAKKFRCVQVKIIKNSEKTVNQQEADVEGVTTNKETTKIEPPTPSPVVKRVGKLRYDEEGGFFETIGRNEFLVSKVREKIKYFIPAFHSTTPEGFNARLTFLHQCMRQGPTQSILDDSSNPQANNLAFGRPPVCVLRVGDFYNTKIIIESMNIDYEKLWDLNPEGIGVQPMMATINLNFKFIGGSDLEGPIQRLQNAVSFNYFANTSAYDDRSDTFEVESSDIETREETRKYNTLYNPYKYKNASSYSDNGHSDTTMNNYFGDIRN